MDKRTAKKICRIELEVALDKIKEATRLAHRIDDAEAWAMFDKRCFEAQFYVADALSCAPDGFLPEDDEKKMMACLKELANLKIEAWVKWEMTRREQEAIASPQGRYGLMRARRLAMEAALQQVKDDDGNGHHD